MNTIFNRKSILFFVCSLLLICSAGTVGYFYYVQRPQILEFDEQRDTPFILDIFNNDWYWLVSEYSTEFSPQYMLHYRASSKAPENIGNLTIKTMYIKNEPVGFVAYYKKNFYEGYILFLALLKKFRSKGYAYQLLSQAIEDLKSRFVTKIRLVTRTINTPAIKLYTRAGFKETSRDDDGFVYFQYTVAH
ncbi:MAG: TDP-fucosamine acetyltransferase [Candidatus Dependentiae bacterium ADurb.Bin331]|nr:MAG: TDP-fucosamine acetyltransferase [Candidatus Dependentiae bacterium ADurb.Bin331]